MSYRKNNQHQTDLKKKDLQKTYNEDLNKRVFKKLGHLILKIKEKNKVTLWIKNSSWVEKTFSIWQKNLSIPCNLLNEHSFNELGEKQFYHVNCHTQLNLDHFEICSVFFSFLFNPSTRFELDPNRYWQIIYGFISLNCHMIRVY